MAIPERVLRTLALFVGFIVHHACRARNASPSDPIEIGVGGALFAIEPIKVRGLVGAILTLLLDHVVSLVGGAGEALPGVEVKVFGMIALDALESCPEPVLGALALESFGVEDLTSWAVLAALVLSIIVLVSAAGLAGLAVENWSCERAVLAGLQIHSVDLVDGAAQALLCVQIKVLRKVALNAGEASPEGTVGAHALPILDDLASGAVLTDFVVGVIVLVKRAGSAFFPIEDRSFRRAWYTALHVNAVDLVGWAVEALLGVQIKVLGEVALDAAEASEEPVLRTLALFGLAVVDLAEAAGSAGLQLLTPVLRVGTG